VPSSSIPAWRRPIDAVAGSALGAAFLRRFAPLLDRPLLKLTRGRFALTFGLPTLLITTTGRKSGEPRSTPLLYLRHGDDLAIIGTKFGSTDHPAWYLNLRAKPEARVTLGGEEFAVAARDAAPDEYAALWQQAKATYGGFEKYEQRVGERIIPIVVLERSRD
jgi:deazaflavin-dependent oxidoreductase (nitroreductase family)